MEEVTLLDALQQLWHHIMIFKNQFVDSLLGKPTVDAAIRTLYNQSDDFPEVYINQSNSER